MQQNYSTTTDSGFTLIEISIVLVIISFIVGGVLVGQDLIRAAEIRSIASDIEKYKTAVYTFKTKYNCLAGDCPNATDFFGARNSDNTVCQTIIPTISSPTLTCNGDSDGRVLDGTEEPFLFWQHLANAGLIKGQYTGIHDGAVIYHHVLGLNAPNAAISGTGFGFSYLDFPNGDTGTYGMNYGNIFWYGRETVHRPQSQAFTPDEAFRIDKKLDDGKPATGFIIARSNNYVWGNANACTTSTSQLDFTGLYNTASKVVTCAFMIKSGL